MVYVYAGDVHVPPRSIFDPPDIADDEELSNDEWTHNSNGDTVTVTTRDTRSTAVKSQKHKKQQRQKQHRQKHPSQLNEIELRVQLWDSYRLARIILGTPIKTFSLKGKTILNSIRKVAEMKLELIRLQKELEMAQVLVQALEPPNELLTAASSSSRSLGGGQTTSNGTTSSILNISETASFASIATGTTKEEATANLSQQLNLQIANILTSKNSKSLSISSSIPTNSDSDKPHFESESQLAATPCRKNTGNREKIGFPQSEDLEYAEVFEDRDNHHPQQDNSTGGKEEEKDPYNNGPHSPQHNAKLLSIEERLELYKSRYEELQSTHENMMQEFQIQLKEMHVQLSNEPGSVHPDAEQRLTEASPTPLNDEAPTSTSSGKMKVMEQMEGGTEILPVASTAPTGRQTPNTTDVDNQTGRPFESEQNDGTTIGKEDGLASKPLDQHTESVGAIASSDIISGDGRHTESLPAKESALSNEDSQSKTARMVPADALVESLEGQANPGESPSPNVVSPEKMTVNVIQDSFSPATTESKSNGSKDADLASPQDLLLGSVPNGNGSLVSSPTPNLTSTTGLVVDTRPMGQEPNSDMLPDSNIQLPQDSTAIMNANTLGEFSPTNSTSPVHAELASLSKHNLLERQKLQEMLRQLMDRVEETSLRTKRQFQALQEQLRAHRLARAHQMELEELEGSDSYSDIEGRNAPAALTTAQHQYEKRLRTAQTLHTLELETLKSRHTQQVVDMSGQLDSYQQQVERQHSELQRWRRKYNHLEEMAVTPSEAKDVLSELESLTPESTEEEKEKVYIKVGQVLQRMAMLQSRQQKDRMEMLKTQTAANEREGRSQEELDFLLLQKEMLEEDTMISPKEWEEQLGQQRKKHQQELSDLFRREEKRMVQMEKLEVELTELAFLAVEIEDLEMEFKENQKVQDEEISKARRNLQLTGTAVENLQSQMKEMASRQRDRVTRLGKQCQRVTKGNKYAGLQARLEYLAKLGTPEEQLQQKEQELQEAKADLLASQKRVRDLELKIASLQQGQTVSPALAQPAD